jgi:hypothetical protein
MKMQQLDIPILVIVFNRPETTKRVLDSIRSVQPTQFFVAADGPRADVDGEQARCIAARRIATEVDWKCEVRTLFRDQNLGCGRNVSSAITWFFETVTEGIILEDDCVASRSFYPYCAELLSYYRDNSKVMHIGGNSFQYGRRRGGASYYLSRYPHIWGWASWSRAWARYDFSLRPAWQLQDTWDTQWQLSIERCDGVTVVPNVNLVSNIGFGSAATHTKTIGRYSFIETRDIRLPLTHPRTLAVDQAADRFTYYSHYRNVRHLNFIWFYRLWDSLYAWAKRLKRSLGGKRVPLRRH